MSATYTVKDVARILGYSTNSIYTFLKEKRIRSVRVGKGRFRIPQTELNRLLMISRGEQPQPADPLAPEPRLIPHEITPFTLPLFGRIHTVSANIFDWFIGVAAVVSGVALFLFNQTFDFVASAPTGPVLPIARILLIGGGLGILLTSIFRDSHAVWHRVFHGILTLAGIIMVASLVVIRDFDGVGIYGALTFVIGLTMVVRLGTILPFVLYLILTSLAAPIIALLAPGDFHVQTMASSLHVSVPVLALGLFGVSAVLIVLFWRGIFRKQSMLWAGSYAAALYYLSLSFLLAGYQYWSRVFFFMTIGLTCMYLPIWKDLVESRDKKAHTLALGVFGTIMGLILIGIAVVYVSQKNVLATVRAENTQKVDYARTVIESDIRHVKAIVTAASINANLVAAVEKKDEKTLTDLSRIIFDSSDNIRRIVILDKNGQGIFLYPWGTFDQKDLSFRDYFTWARDAGKLYVSDIFESLVDNAQRKTTVVSAPMYSPQGTFVGVFVASIDLTAISARLQKIAVAQRGEYIVVLDRRGKRIMHPDSSLIGTDTNAGDPTLLGSQGQTGVEEWPDFQGIRSLTAYTGIDSVGWAISLKAPFTSIYALSGTANTVVVSLLIDCIVIAALIVQLTYLYKYKQKNNGGSP